MWAELNHYRQWRLVDLGQITAKKPLGVISGRKGEVMGMMVTLIIP